MAAAPTGAGTEMRTIGNETAATLAPGGITDPLASSDDR